MASPRSHRRVIEEKNRKIKLSEKSMSFQGYITGRSTSDKYRMPRTAPDLFSVHRSTASGLPELQIKPKLTKLLLNVTIQRSLGPLQVLISPESTVHDLISAVVRQYSKEGRRPALCSTDFSDYDLHYSQFSLDSLERAEKLMALGTRNFFLCPKKLDCSDLTASSSTCKKQAVIDTDDISIDLPLPKFMDFML